MRVEGEGEGEGEDEGEGEGEGVGVGEGEGHTHTHTCTNTHTQSMERERVLATAALLPQRKATVGGAASPLGLGQPNPVLRTCVSCSSRPEQNRMLAAPRTCTSRSAAATRTTEAHADG